MPEFRKPPRLVAPAVKAPVSLKKPQNAVMPAPENTVGSPAYNRMLAAKKAAPTVGPQPLSPSQMVTELPFNQIQSGGGGVAMPGTENMPTPALPPGATFKKGGKVKKMASGGMTSKVSSASKRADGIATRGKTKCKMY